MTIGRRPRDDPRAQGVSLPLTCWGLPPNGLTGTNTNMAMKLTALAGPRRGDTFPIPEGVFTIGRSRANALALEMDFRVSRHHCVVERLGEQCTIRDLESHNRTRVNDVEIGDGRLSHGDEIQIGESVFAFLVDGQPPPRPRARIDLDDGEEVPGSTVTMRPGNAGYVDPDAVLTAIADGLPAPRALVASPSGRPTADRMSRVMKSVIRVCRAVTSGKGLTDLQRRVLESVMEGVPAGRAAILLGGGSTDELTSALHWTRSGGEAPSFRIPRRVVQAALEKRAAVCINDALNDSLKPSPTMLEAEIGALMAVTVLAADTVIGALYVDASDPEARFSEDDLHLLLAIADVCAVPLANALRTERLERENERLLGQIVGDHPLLGASDQMRSVHRFITKVAGSESTVLIAGASGTGKSSSPAPFTVSARERRNRSSRSTAPPSLNRCWKASSLVTRKGPSRVPTRRRKANSKRPTAGPYSWTRSASWHCRSRPSCCACCRSVNSTGSAAAAPTDQDQHTPHRGHQSRSRRGNQTRRVQAGPVLSTQCRLVDDAGAPRAQG